MSTPSPSTYLRFLPEVYQRDAAFLGRYLRVFEDLIGVRNASGASGASPRRGMASVLDVLPALLSPRLAFLFPGNDSFVPPIAPAGRPESEGATLAALNQYLGLADPAGDGAPIRGWLRNLVDWMASWLAFVPEADWSIDKRRLVVASLMPMFRMRGTQLGLESLLRLLVDDGIRVVDASEAAAPLVIGVTSVVRDGAPAEASDDEAADARLDGIRPYTFMVELDADPSSAEDPRVRAMTELVTKIVDREKPVHATYEIRLRPRPTTPTPRRGH